MVSRQPCGWAGLCNAGAYLLGLFGTLGAVAEVVSPAQPQYPLLHIGVPLNCSGTAPCTKDSGADGNGRDYDYTVTVDDARVLRSFSLLHMSPKRQEEVALIRRLAPGRPIVKYTESVPVCGGSAGQDTPYSICNATFNFETGGFRKDARLYHAGNLTQPLTATSTVLDFCLGVPFCCQKYGTPLVASTAPGRFSDYDGSTYVTFLRVGDELMKIVAAETSPNPDRKVPGLCQRLTVQRGLDGTVPTAAVAGTPVLAPIFVRTPEWHGPRASGKLSYQADYASFYAWSSLANFTVDAVEQLGYDGAWFDSFSPSEVANNADTGGMKVKVWNPRTGQPYTGEEAFQAQLSRLQKVWAATKARLGRFPVIWANNFENWVDQPTPHGISPGDRRFMLPGPNGERPFDGCSLENWQAAFKGPGCFAQTGDVSKWTVVYNDEQTWVSRVNTMIDATALNLSVAAMTGSAGCQSPLQTYLPAATRTQLDLLHYASYLLTVARKGGAGSHGPLLGTSAFFAPDDATGHARGLSYGRLWEAYTWPLGGPLVTHSNVTAYRVTPPWKAGVYVRYFESAVVVVNPGNESASVATPLQRGPYEDKLTGETGLTAVRMPLQSARILLRQ